MTDLLHIDQQLNHLFRHESGKMVAVLVKVFGSENYELAEDVVQDALLKALETWKFRGMPDNPKAWLYRVAKNKAIDIIRRKKHDQTIDFSDPERKLLTSEYTLSVTLDSYWQDDSVRDDFLGMMFACCHPGISEENQITFILKSLCGFSTKEIAKSFFTSEDTISKRIYRTKEYFRQNRTRPKLPPSDQLPKYLNAVLNAIYLIFNEGYNATHADELIRKDLISQAMLLCKSLLEHERTAIPETYALMALVCFHTSRIESRLSPEGKIIPLDQQDRGQWSQEMIIAGMDFLKRSAFGEKLSTFHLEAAIAYEHCIATDYSHTNWKAILDHYDALMDLAYDPVVFLNRCVVLMELKGPQEALEALQSIQDEQSMRNFYLYHAVLGELLERLGEREQATAAYEQARQLTLSKQEQRFLADKILGV